MFDEFLEIKILKNQNFCFPDLIWKSIYHTPTIITRGLYIFYLLFIAVYIVDQLVLQSIYVLNKKILQF